MISPDKFGHLIAALAIGALLSAIVTLGSTPGGVAGSSSDVVNFANSVANPSEVNVDTPTGRFSNNPISAVFSYATEGAGWLGFLANAATLDFPFFKAWAQPWRYMALFIMYTGVMAALGIDLLKASLNMIGGAFSRAASVLGG